MFRKLSESIQAAAASVVNRTAETAGVAATTTNSHNDAQVASLVALGFDVPAVLSALQSTHGNADQAAELLLSSQGSANNNLRINNANRHFTPSAQSPAAEDEALQRVMMESAQLENARRNNEFKSASAINTTRSAAVHKAGQAAVLRATGAVKDRTLSSHHPNVKLIPKLQDKSKEEQILRCADRLKVSPPAVDTLLRALTAIRDQPHEPKFRKIDQTTAGFQRSLSTAPGAHDFLYAMNFRSSSQTTLVLSSEMLDPALLYLGITALEQIRTTREYKLGKQKLAFAKNIQAILQSANVSEAQALQQSEHMSKCPAEPADGRGAFMQVVMAEEIVKRRFDGDDTLLDVLHWLGGHGATIYDKIMSREWSLVDLNSYPLVPIDCQAHQNHTLQYIGCWPSGRLEIIATPIDWMQPVQTEATAANNTLSFKKDLQRGSSRGLGAAPSDLL